MTMMDTIQDRNYNNLCELYERYKSAVKIIHIRNSYDCTFTIKQYELNTIMQAIEMYPISWNYYKKKKRFNTEFENLIIFSDEK